LSLLLYLVADRHVTEGFRNDDYSDSWKLNFRKTFLIKLTFATAVKFFQKTDWQVY